VLKKTQTMNVSIIQCVFFFLLTTSSESRREEFGRE
jgi:hypothetical protein